MQEKKIPIYKARTLLMKRKKSITLQREFLFYNFLLICRRFIKSDFCQHYGFFVWRGYCEDICSLISLKSGTYQNCDNFENFVNSEKFQEVHRLTRKVSR